MHTKIFFISLDMILEVTQEATPATDMVIVGNPQVTVLPLTTADMSVTVGMSDMVTGTVTVMTVFPTKRISLTKKLKRKKREGRDYSCMCL